MVPCVHHTILREECSQFIRDNPFHRFHQHDLDIADLIACYTNKNPITPQEKINMTKNWANTMRHSGTWGTLLEATTAALLHNNSLHILHSPDGNRLNNNIWHEWAPRAPPPNMNKIILSYNGHNHYETSTLQELETSRPLARPERYDFIIEPPD